MDIWQTGVEQSYPVNDARFRVYADDRQLVADLSPTHPPAGH